MNFDADRFRRLRDEVASQLPPAESEGVLSELDDLIDSATRLALETGKVSSAQADALVNSALMMAELEAAKTRLEEEAGLRARAEAMFRSVVEGTARGTGQRFLGLLTQHLAHAVGGRFAIVGRVLPPENERVRVLAAWAGDGPADTFEYELAGSPCERACEGQVCFYANDVQTKFPEDKLLVDMGVHSYLGTPLFDASGSLIGIIAVLGERALDEVDLASSVLEVFAVRAAAELERAMFDSEMQAARSSAEQASQAKSRFLAKMSHEIRTPLNGVLGTSEILTATELDDSQRELVDIIRDAGGNLLSIVNDVLDLSKVEAGKISIEAAPFDVREQASNVVRLLRPRAEQKSLQLTLRIDDDLPPRVLGDAARVRQVLTNFLGNAVRYTDAGAIEVRVQRDATISDGVRIEVRDTGPGIPESCRERIFESFEQVAETANGAGGTGLGLSIARQLVEMMRGELGVESEIGIGSTFWATIPLPCVSDTPGAEGRDEVADPPTPERRWPGLRVLVAEDNRVNQLVASRLLGALGCEVELVDDGEAAIGAVQNQDFDIVFMDSQMPKLDGIEATKRIRADASLTHLPIVSLSANAFAEHKDTCLAVGMDDAIDKPVSRDDLEAVLARWCASRQRPA